jgi:acetyltransferase-like isoleucine patch superfamily enzyme
MVGNNVMISGLENIDIGDDVSIGTGSFIRANGGLKIGSNVVISRNLVLYTTSHNYEGDRLPFDSTDIYNQVIIEDNVWIGMNVTISPGSIIREGAIIGLGSAVWGEVGKGQIIGSDRPKVIKYRDEGHYEKLRKKSG